MGGKWLVNVRHVSHLLGLAPGDHDRFNYHYGTFKRLNPFTTRFKLVMVHCTCLLRMTVFNTIKYSRGDPVIHLAAMHGIRYDSIDSL